MKLKSVKAVLDVRREKKSPSEPLVEDANQETQLLPGEQVAIIEEQGDWAYIEAVDQPCFRQSWSGYKGWVSAEGLGDLSTKPNAVIGRHNAKIGSKAYSIGTKLTITEEKADFFETNLGLITKTACFTESQKIYEPRQFLIDTAASFMGMPYQWGGRSTYLPGHYPISSVDCSGLVNLCFLLMGQIVPRDAHDQWLKASAVQPSELRAGDLIFTAKASRPERITHVMIYKGDNRLIEAASAAGKVQEISVSEKLGAPLNALGNGIEYDDKVIFFGTFL